MRPAYILFDYLNNPAQFYLAKGRVNELNMRPSTAAG